jgi:DNA repair protein RadA/Sms
MKKSKTSFFCQHCGYMSPKWLGKCSSCNGWNCFAEELIVDNGSDSRNEMRSDGKSLPIEDIPVTEGKRTVTGIAEVDRVLGGGLDLFSHKPRCSRIARIRYPSSMKLMIRMAP